MAARRQAAAWLVLLLTLGVQRDGLAPELVEVLLAHDVPDDHYEGRKGAASGFVAHASDLAPGGSCEAGEGGVRDATIMVALEMRLGQPATDARSPPGMATAGSLLRESSRGRSRPAARRARCNALVRGARMVHRVRRVLGA